MRTALQYSAIAFVVALAGCGDERAANERNFGAALSKALGQDLCLGFGLKEWPVRVNAAGWDEGVKQFDVLEKAGLVKVGQTVDLPDISPFGGQVIGVKRFKLYEQTAKGQQFYREKDVAENMFEPAKKGDFCYGKLGLGSVLKWEGPKRNGDYAEATVFYTYKIDDLADWTAAPEIRATFPRVGQFADGAGKSETSDVVRLTSAGWEAGPLSIVNGLWFAGALK
ncbi:MAG: hypothetical protein WBO09_01995 [Methylocystis silviterrae]|uniref:hypothetical protein n=1 Tax=Methylocystis silviterrae TaxID=2743612 RepID=UPI003C738921